MTILREELPKPLVWHRLYDPTSNLQVIPDLSRHGYSLTRGATAGVGTDDPAWGTDGKGLVFGGDDFALTGNLAGVSMAGDWTWMTVGCPLDAGGAKYWGGLANVDNQYAVIKIADVGLVAVRCRNTYAGGTSPTLSVSTTANQALVLRSTGGNLILTNWGTGISVSTPNVSPIGVPVLGLGSIPQPTKTGTYAEKLVTQESVFYPRVLSNAQIQAWYRRIKAYWKTQGISIL